MLIAALALTTGMVATSQTQVTAPGVTSSMSPPSFGVIPKSCRPRGR